MIHKTFWTAEKIGRRIKLLEDSQVVYRQAVTLPPFRYLELSSTSFEPAPSGSSCHVMLPASPEPCMGPIAPVSRTSFPGTTRVTVR